MAEKLQLSRNLKLVFSTGEQAARQRGAYFLDTQYVFLGIAQTFPELLGRIGIEPALFERFADVYGNYDNTSPEKLEPSRKTTATTSSAEALARRERAQLVTVGHWITAYFKEAALLGSPIFEDTSVDLSVVISRIEREKPFRNEPISIAEELVQEALDEP